MLSCPFLVKTEPLNSSDTVTTTGDTALDTYAGSGMAHCICLHLFRLLQSQNFPSCISNYTAESFNPLKYCLSLNCIIKGWTQEDIFRQTHNPLRLLRNRTHNTVTWKPLDKIERGLRSSRVFVSAALWHLNDHKQTLCFVMRPAVGDFSLASVHSKCFRLC